MKKIIITIFLLFISLYGYSQLNNKRYLRSYSYHQLVTLPNMIVDEYADVDNYQEYGDAKNHFIFVFTHQNDIKDIFVFLYDEVASERREMLIYEHIYPSRIDRETMLEYEKKTGVFTTIMKYGLPIYFDDKIRKIDSLQLKHYDYTFYLNDSSTININLNGIDNYIIKFEDSKMGFFELKR